MMKTPLSLFLFFLIAAPLLADEWPQWRGPERDGVWRESGIISEFPEDGLEVRWRQPIGAGYSGPTVADGRVYVTDRLVKPEQIERVHCFDWKNGSKRWTFEYPCAYTISYTAGPRASITIDDDRAFVLGAMGHLHCLDAGTGKVLWKRDLNQEFQLVADNRMPIWGIAAAPLVYNDLVIVVVGGKDATVVAFDTKYGDRQWSALRDRAQYASPILIRQAGVDVLVIWTGDSVAGVDPANGKVHWRHPFAPREMPIGVATPVVHADRLFMTSFYDGAMMLKLQQDQPTVEQVWHRRGADEKNTDGLQSIISTPVFDGEHIYGVDSYGELRCLDASNGDRIWEDQTATPRERWSTIHFVQHDDRYWLFNERGNLILADLSPSGYHELGRTHLIDPTLEQLPRRGGVTWSHPAFAHRHIFARNDKELVCVSLEAD
jgi:outer membrane protein assembly factor BamB